MNRALGAGFAASRRRCILFRFWMRRLKINAPSDLSGFGFDGQNGLPDGLLINRVKKFL